MSQLRLIWTQTSGSVTKQRRKKSVPSSIVLPGLKLLSWKLERLQKERPAIVDVIERLVDDMLDELEGRRP